jgi:hypothetical protein
MNCKPEDHGAAKCPDCEDSGERLEKLVEQLDEDLRKASRTAYELYASDLPGGNRGIAASIKARLFQSLNELRKLGWDG